MQQFWIFVTRDQQLPHSLKIGINSNQITENLDQPNQIIKHQTWRNIFVLIFNNAIFPVSASLQQRSVNTSAFDFCFECRIDSGLDEMSEKFRQVLEKGFILSRNSINSHCIYMQIHIQEGMDSDSIIFMLDGSEKIKIRPSKN